MLRSAIELLSELVVSALTLVIGICIVGSTVAALRAVGRVSRTEATKR